MTRRHADVAILGGGIIGCSLAADLAGAGLAVRLFEPATIAAGASGRNSGVVQHPLDAVLAGLYFATVREYRALAAEVDGFALDDEPAGMLFVGRDPARADRTAAAWRAAWPATDAEVLAGPMLERLEPALAPDLVACRLQMGYPVAPAAATEAFARLAERRGVDITLGGDARVAVEGDRAIGVAFDGELEPAGTVVIAAGPWSAELADPTGAWRPIGRTWGVVAGIALGAAAPRHGLEAAGIDIEPLDGPTEDPLDTRDADLVDDELVDFSLARGVETSGLGSTFLPTEPDPAAWLPALRRVGSRYVPAVADAPLVGMRSCARPVSLDGRPLLGRVPGRRDLWIATGHGPWGISTGPASARLVADALLSGTDDLIPEPLRSDRFGSPGATSVSTALSASRPDRTGRT